MSKSFQETIQQIVDSADFIELHESSDLKIDLKYATADNFVGRNLYLDFNRAFLHRFAFDHFTKSREYLARTQPGYQFLIFDVLRPRSVQWLLWNEVVGTEKEIYIAPPERGSIHNYGLAIDLTLLNEKGQELDMGTPFDSFQPLAQPRQQADFVARGLLSPKQVENRQLLCDVMAAGGFIQLPTEWWHFDALPREQIKKDFVIIE